MASDFYGVDPYGTTSGDPYGLAGASPLPRAPAVDYGPTVVPLIPRMLAPVLEAIGRGVQGVREGAQGLRNSVVPFPHGGAAAEQPQPAEAKRPPGSYSAPLIGRDLPLARLVDLQRKAESSGNYQALNREKKGNTASGAYQYTDRTWNGYGGYGKAMLAPRAVQDKRFAEDVARRVNKYNGDVFKSIADHYLPALANSPERWNEHFQIKTKGGKVITVKPVATYLKHVLKGTPYEKQLEAYLNGQ